MSVSSESSEILLIAVVFFFSFTALYVRDRKLVTTNSFTIKNQ